MRSQSAAELLLDATVLCRFADHGLLSELRGYLGDRARITREVERELLRLADAGEFSQLHDHLAGNGPVARAQGKWPKHTKNLPDGLKPEFARILGLKHSLGEHERAHAGEIATVLMAVHRRTSLVLIDDNWGSDLARKTYGLEVMSTARLVLEMVVAGALAEDEGFAVYDSATPREVGRLRYEAGLRRLRSECS
ncbi:MAG: hypothetical protein V2J16_11670 [Thermoleophilia bacterium]|jgi:predicted nucleic acid-binding protein|nr:hypothetical protein [Thermoleophilia bacterium]